MAGSKDKSGDKRPIIIKKIKKGGHGHHGGAWKVAYADFVTAMMAFFLLLWLLSTASKDTLKGLSEYFTPTQGIKDEMGIGFDGGMSPNEEGISKSSQSNPSIVTGRSPSGIVADNPDNRSPSDANEDDNLFKKGASAVEQAFSSDETVKQYAENVSVRQTPEGLRIDITDSDKYPMFAPASPQLTQHGQIILAKIATLIKKMPNFMAISGHTDASPAETGRIDYTNWELSADRAQSARRFLNRSGIELERTKRVTGMADRELFVPNEPRSPRNRRVSLLMLRGSHILIPESAVPTKSDDSLVFSPAQRPAKPAFVPPPPAEKPKPEGSGH
jgi:chemotaxis protein MotB